MVMPGRNFITSPGVPSTIVPNSSAATTLIIERAKRCSLMAMAAPSMSFEVETTKSESFTTPSAEAPGVVAPGAAGLAPTAAREKFCCAVWPAVTVTAEVCGARPVKKMRTRAVPAGTSVKRYWPVSSVNVSCAVPSRVTRARSRYSARAGS
jgi:hypothetical protein